MMRDVLESVTSLEGVRLAAVLGRDGLPLCVLEEGPRPGEWVDATAGGPPSGALRPGESDSSSLVAFAASWVDDLSRTSEGVGWEFEKRFTLVGSEGALVVQLGPGANVLAVLGPDVTPESVALPMDVSVERLQRLLREMGRRDLEQLPAPFAGGKNDAEGVAGAMPTDGVNGAVPIHKLMDDPVGKPGAAADLPAAGAATDATNRFFGDH
ncbi:MAG: hypothetical protein P8R46_09905 [Planctomycetota bacterium]|nr:hypothetical protein [Planctomycetota bacterium]